MARAWHDWTIRDLADAAGVSHATIANIEAGRPVRPALLAAVRQSIEETGLRFTDDSIILGPTGLQNWDRDEYLAHIETCCAAAIEMQDIHGTDFAKYAPAMVFRRKVEQEFILAVLFVALGQTPTPQKIFDITKSRRNLSSRKIDDIASPDAERVRLTESELTATQQVFESAYRYVITELDDHPKPIEVANRLTMVLIKKCGSASEAALAAKSNPKALFDQVSG